MTQAVRRISVESYVIAAIALLDLVLTISLIEAQQAREGNPLMNFYLQFGVVPFIIAKGVFTAMPILILEWARTHRPGFVRLLSRAAIAAYVGMYAVMFVQTNLRADTYEVELSETYYYPVAASESPTDVNRGVMVAETY